MNKIRKMVKENNFARTTCFILFNALCLFLLFFLIKGFPNYAGKIGSAIGTIFGAAKPFIIGLIIAYILSPLVNFVDKKFVSRVFKLPDNPEKLKKRSRLYEVISIIISLLIVFLAAVFLIYSFAALIMGQISIKGMEETIMALTSGAVDYQQALEQTFNIKLPETFNDQISEYIGDISDWLSKNISITGITSGVISLGGSIANFVIGIIFAIYLLIDKKFFIDLWRRFISLASPKNHVRLNGTLSEVHEVLTSFIKGACVDSLIIAVLSSIALTVLGLEGSVLIGVFAGMANLIPYFGPILGMIPAFFMGLVTEGFWQGAVAVILLFIIQQIDSNIIYPKVVGKQTGLRPLFVLFSITFLGYFGGIVGMLLAVPIAGVVQVFVLKIVKRREKILMERAERKLKESGEEVSDTPDVPVSENDSNQGDDHEEGKESVD